MRVLVACEESQAVTKELRKLGHEAYSCDLVECSGGHPEWHIKGDVLNVLKPTVTNGVHACPMGFRTQNGEIQLFDGTWDMMIAHPPCTYLSVSGLHWNKRDPERAEKTEAALEFVRKLMEAPIDKIAIENPVSCISTRIRKPDQIIQPYQFGDDASKKTCLWLKNLPKLIGTEYVEPRMVDGKPRWSNQTDSGQNKLPPSKDRARLRSITYPGIARAIAEQFTAPTEGE